MTALTRMLHQDDDDVKPAPGLTFAAPALRARLIRAVEAAIADAGPGQIRTDVHDDGRQAVDVRWRRRLVHAVRTDLFWHRRNHAIYVDRWGPVTGSGPVLMTAFDEPEVRFIPSDEFDTPAALLDWFERGEA